MNKPKVSSDLFTLENVAELTQIENEVLWYYTSTKIAKS